MKIALTFLVILASMTCSFAQKTLRHTVYFPTDKHHLTDIEQKRLDQFIKDLEAEKILAVHLSGHTDSDASDEYNIDLSKRRVETVQNRLLKSLAGEFEWKTNHYGEKRPVSDNSSSEGKQNNRRVDIIVDVAAQKTLVQNTEEFPPPPDDRLIEEPTIEGDTLIELPEGTWLELPIKDYLMNPDCISVTGFVRGESIRAAGLTTMTDDGETLISAGMFDVQMCDESKCIKLLVPIRTVCGQTMPFTQWTAEAINGSWSEKSGRPLPIRIIGERSYYEMEICGSGSVNCDVRAPRKKCKRLEPKTRIKLKGGYRFKTVLLSSDDPLMGARPIRQTKRKAVYYRTCPCSEQYLYVEATTKNGATEILEYRPLDDFDKREAFGKCKEEEIIKKILFFKIKKKTTYRKYLIRKSDFEKE